jgi:hypothetical protein
MVRIAPPWRVGNSVTTATLLSLNLSGPTSITEGSFGTFSVTGTYSDGKTLPVNDAVLTVNTTGVTIQGYKVTVGTNAVSGDTRTVQVTVTKSGISKSVNVSLVDATVVTPPTTTAKRIFLPTASAWPGQAINLAGSFSTSAKFYLKTTTAAAVELAPATNGTVSLLVENNATLRIPTSTSFDQYEVYVVDGGVNYASVFINQAEVWGMNTDEVCQEGTVEMTGQNLQIFPGLGKVQLQKVGTPTKIDMVTQVNKSTQERVRFTLPAGVATGDYKVFFYNGFGSSVDSGLQVKVIAKGNDSYGLGSRVPVAGKFSTAANVFNAVTRENNQGDKVLPVAVPTDGTSDCLSAIKQQLAYLKANNIYGRLYFPSGVYVGFTDNELFIPSGIVLDGPADQSAIIRVTGNAPNNRYVFVWEDGSQLNGMRNLRFENVCTINDTLAWRNMVGVNGKDRFVKNCSFNLSESEWLQDLHCTRLYWLDNYIQQGINRQSRPRQRGYGRFEETLYGVFDNNTVDFAVEGINFHGSKNTYHSNNKLTWNGTLGNREEIVNHFTVWGNSENCACYGDYLTTDANYQSIKDMEILKYVGKPTNDGESYIAEETGGEAVYSFGSLVTSATTKVINFPSLSLQPSDQYYVRIISGKGMGQTRKVASYSATQLTVAEDLDVAPDANSHISIFVFNLRKFLLQGIKLVNVKRGPTLYWAHIDRCIVSDFDMVNSGAIDFTPRQNYDEQGRVKINMQWGVVIKNNVSNVSTDTFNGSFFGMHMVLDNSNFVFGTGGLGLVMRNNKLTARNPNVRCRVDNNYLNAAAMIDTEWHPDGRSFGGTVPAILGAIIEDCEGINCESTLDTSRAVHNTYIRNLKHNGQALTLASVRGDQGNGFPIHNDFLGGSSGTTNLLILTDTIEVPTAPTAPVVGTDARSQVDGATGAPNVSYEAPLMILSSMAGTDGVIRISNRNFQSTDPGTAAITLNCGRTPVVLSNINVKHMGRGISGGTDSNVKGTDIGCYGLSPTLNGQSRERAIYMYKPYSVDLQYLTIESAGGVKIDYWNGDNSAASVLKFRNVRVRNVIGINGDFRHALQFSNVHTKNFLVDWVEVNNEAGRSRTEDTINIYNSGGWDAANPMIVRNVFLKGAYPENPTDNYFTGAALSADGSGDPAERHSEYISVYNAYLVSHGNAAANIATGSYITYDKLYAVTTGYLPDGRPMTCSYKGFWIGAFYGGGGTMVENYMKNITTYFVRTKDVIRRADFVADPAVPSETPNAGIDVANAILLPAPANATAALEMERQAFLKWRDDLNTNNQTCGARR